MKIISTGQSLKELKEEYGIGANGFYPQSWYDLEGFFTDKPEAGEYEVNIEEKALTNLTYDEQVGKLKKGYEVPHPAILMQALLEYHKTTGKYAISGWYSRTSLLGSGGLRVLVGYCAVDGVYVPYSWDAHRYDYVGLSAVLRKFDTSLDTRSLEPIESSPLELRVKSLEEDMEKIKKFLII